MMRSTALIERRRLRKTAAKIHCDQTRNQATQTNYSATSRTIYKRAKHLKLSVMKGFHNLFQGCTMCIANSKIRLILYSRPSSLIEIDLIFSVTPNTDNHSLTYLHITEFQNHLQTTNTIYSSFTKYRMYL